MKLKQKHKNRIDDAFSVGIMLEPAGIAGSVY